MPHAKGCLHPLTRRLADEEGARFAEVHGLSGYADFLAERWRDGVAFVNWEQDVVPWPGAVDELRACSEPWCGFAYKPYQVVGENASAYLGLVRFSAPFIAATPGVFEPGPHWTAAQPRTWQHCDGHLWNRCAERPEAPRFHQHFPAVVNARG